MVVKVHELTVKKLVVPGEEVDENAKYELLALD